MNHPLLGSRGPRADVRRAGAGAASVRSEDGTRAPAVKARGALGPIPPPVYLGVTMVVSPSPSDSDVLRRLAAPGPLVAAELRPPPPGLEHAESIDRWVDLHHAIQWLTDRGAPVFLTDRAVGGDEEENLRHLTTSLAGEIDRSRIVPFLTCKHSLDYCLRYADRAASHGIQALTVLGGDRSIGPPRCVDHAYELRQLIRRRVPSLTLGGWANPHRPAGEQVGYLLEDEATAEFYLTQVVSHHDLESVEAFLEEARRRELDLPAVWGVFFYRSANPDTLERLSRFFRVPVEGLKREFAEGRSPVEICARTIRALRELGIEKVYVSNLGVSRAEARLQGVLERVEA